MLYVIGDTHGCYTELMNLFKKIESKDPKAEYILVGDIYDRGKEILPLCKWAMENINNVDGKYKMIMGNHEYEAIQCYNEIPDIELLKANWDEYKNCVHDMYHSLKQIPDFETYDNIIKFFKGLPYLFDINVNGKRYIIVHADLPGEIVNEDGSLKDKSEWTKLDKEKIVWDRNYWGIYEPEDATVIHGHTPTISHDYHIRNYEVKEGTVGFGHNQINIDCGCVFQHYGYKDGNLAALCLNTLEVTYER